MFPKIVNASVLKRNRALDCMTHAPATIALRLIPNTIQISNFSPGPNTIPNLKPTPNITPNHNPQQARATVAGANVRLPPSV